MKTVSFYAKATLMILIVQILAVSSALANTFYAVAAGGYVENETQFMSVDTPSYKLGIGYQFHPKWYLETGFQLLGEQNTDIQDIGFDDPLYEASGLYVSALGKASGRSGELFYRIGVMKADIKTTQISASTCDTIGLMQVAAVNGGNLCSSDDGILAGMLGIGFDYYLSSSLLIRSEVEHIQGESEYSANAIYIGLRVNF
jgi:hypothetical protein